ncbi:MAG: metallophosphoesterase [bacterium]|nr:metallophosphoesterase [bacterium]
MKTLKRLRISSDLHYGASIEGDAAVRAFARMAISQGTPQEALLLGGDLAATEDDLHQVLALLREYPGIKAAIPGNHDIWVPPGSTETSWDRYRKATRIFREHGFHPLTDTPLILGDFGIAGALGWYDYGFRDGIGIPVEAYQQKTYHDSRSGMIHQWADSQYARWSMSDRQVTELELTRLEDHLRCLAHLPEVLVLTHHVPTKKLLVHPRFIVPRHWRFLNAFLGSERFAELIRRFPNVRNVVSGHIHRSATARIGDIKFTAIGSGRQFRESITITEGRISRNRHLGTF